MTLAITVWVSSEIGRVRSRQEDAYVLNPGQRTYAVADGMGGMSAGDEAARCVCQTLSALKARESLEHAIQRANTEVFAWGHGSSGTTVVAWRYLGREVQIAWVGDSRAYRLRNRNLSLLTHDHTAAARSSVELSRNHPSRNVLERALGTRPTVNVDLRSDEPEAGDRYLLCSDGLWSLLEDAEIQQSLRQHPDCQMACRDLVQRALDAGGSDNVTVLLLGLE